MFCNARGKKKNAMIRCTRVELCVPISSSMKQDCATYGITTSRQFMAGPHRKTDNHLHSHTHTYGQFSVSNSPQMPVFGLLEEGGEPRTHGDMGRTCKLSTGRSRESNPQLSCGNANHCASGVDINRIITITSASIHFFLKMF